MLHPTEAIAIAPAISSAHLISFAPASSSTSAAVTGMFHTLWTVTIRPRRTLQDSAGLPPGLYSPNTCPSNKILGWYLLTSALTMCQNRNIRIYAQHTPNSARSHYITNSGIHIYLITSNNASLCHNSKYVRPLQERTLNNPDFPRHHRRAPPVKAAISHGDHETV